VAEENTGVTDSAQVGVSTTTDSPSAPSTTTPTETSAGAVKSESLETQTTESDDPLAGLPTNEELTQMVAQKVPMAEGMLRLRTEYDKIAPVYKEKYQPFEPVIDRFESPDRATELLEMQDDLYRQNRTDYGLEPDPSKFVERISTESPLTADYLTRHLVWGNTVDQRTGQSVPRFVPLLEAVAEDPELKAQALQILGGVEPSQIPQPTWSPTQEELDKFSTLNLSEKDTIRLQDLYRKLPYEKRDEIRMNSPEFIKDYLEDQELKSQVKVREEREQQAKAQQIERERHEFRQATEQAGAQYIDTSIKEGFNGFVEGIVKDWQPTDDPILNKVAGTVVGVATVALAHGETRFAGEALLAALNEMGMKVDPSEFDKSLSEFVDQARNYGELSFQAERQRHPGYQSNGNGDKSINHYKAEAGRSRQRLLALARTTIAANLMTAFDKFFVARADAHNENLTSGAPARPVTSGSAVVNTSGNPYIGRKRDEIWAR